MNRGTRNSLVSAFTLVELLVVIAIITLLIGIALPAFKHAKQAAKRTATKAVISSIEGGLTAYREERALGNTYPPSASDSRATGEQHSTVKDPITGGTDVRVAGASLLVYGLAGADNEGTAGFKPLAGKASWAESFGGTGATGGLYDADDNPPHPRYGPFAGSNLMDRITRISELERFPVTSLGQDDAGGQKFAALNDAEKTQRVFVDDFGGPILYYKARGAARQMITNPDTGKIGIYDFRDNWLLTQYPKSELQITLYDDDNDPTFGKQPGRFDSFIIDNKGSRQNTSTGQVSARPVRPDDLLLISAGPDLLFGTKDDVVNWNK